MYLAFHPFKMGAYSGMLVLTGLPRPSATKSLWKQIFSEFDDVLHKAITDAANTQVPGIAEVPQGFESAVKLELARAHCLRKYQQAYQGSLILGIAANFNGLDQVNHCLYLPHPSLTLGMLSKAGDLNEVKTTSPKVPPTWVGLEQQENSELSFFFKKTKFGTVRALPVSVSRDRCFRLSTFLRDERQVPLFHCVSQGRLL